jgi:CO dehydrogenase maturation factor
MYPNALYKPNISKEFRIFAIVGKGGAGKTTFTYLFAKEMMKNHIHPLLIDADPTMSHLTRMMGVSPKNSIENIRTHIISLVAPKDKKKDTNQMLAENVDSIVKQSIYENELYSLLAMGQPETAGCFCPVNHLIKNVIETLGQEYQTIIIDCEAGLEQIHRNVISQVDYLLIITDTSTRSIETAKMILNSAKKFTHFKKAGLIINRVKEPQKEVLIQTITTLNIPLLGFLPEDPNISQLELEGKGFDHLPNDSPSIIAILDIFKKICQL